MNQETRVTTWHPDGTVAQWRPADSPPRSYDDDTVYVVWACGEHHLAWYESFYAGGHSWVKDGFGPIDGVEWWAYAPVPPEVER